VCVGITGKKIVGYYSDDVGDHGFIATK
jgi:hypothetical protein